MLLCDRHWNILTVPDARASLLPLDHILALLNWYRVKLLSGFRTRNSISTHVQVDPRPVVELCALIDHSGLGGLISAPTALAAIAAADRRQCSGQIAEAIMFVIGSVSWCARSTYRYPDSDTGDVLVLGVIQ